MNPNKPDTALMTDGLYAYTRNPIYVCFLLVQLGVGIWMNSLWVMGMTAATAVALTRLVIEKEEAYLERRHGSAYLVYKDRVPRWF